MVENMTYNDFKLIGEREAKLMQQSHSEIELQELSDLREIREKLIEQRDHLKLNKNYGINNILDTMDKNINTIDKLINTALLHKKTPKYSLNLGRIQNIDNPQVYGKIPSHNEMMRMESYNTTNNNIPMENNTNNITPNENIIPPTPNNAVNNPPSAPTQRDGRRTTNNRSFPMQGSILSSITKAISMKFSHKSKHLEIPLDEYHNRFHNVSALDYPYNHHNCDPSEKCITRQVDLLRLLVLFITLQPHCRHVRPICGVLNDQFDVFLKIMK